MFNPKSDLLCELTFMVKCRAQKNMIREGILSSPPYDVSASISHVGPVTVVNTSTGAHSSD